MTRRGLDQVLVVDGEATCWEESLPSDEEQEIIEIGICPLIVATGERLPTESILVRPQRSRVSDFCQRLTTLTEEQIAMGLSFVEACAQLRERYRAHERVWAGFGDFDHLLFERQCRRQGLPYPFGSRHLNIKTLLALFLGLPAELDLATALQRLGLPLERARTIAATTMPGISLPSWRISSRAIVVPRCFPRRELLLCVRGCNSPVLRTYHL